MTSTGEENRSDQCLPYKQQCEGGREREADRLTETARDRDRGETDRQRLRQGDIDSVSK